MERTPTGLTIADVAKRANCSVATASRVLSGSKYPVSEEMRARILEAAAGLGYSANLKQRMSADDQNPFLGVIVPTFQNPTYLQYIRGIERAANSAGYTTIILNSHRDAALERQQINSLIQKKIGALMLMSVDESSDALHHYLDMGGVACVFESNFPDWPDVLNAKSNRFEAGRMATEYLISHGHRSIAFVTTPLRHFQSRRLTLDGCRFAVEKCAFPFSIENIFMSQEESDSSTGLHEFEVGYAMAEKVLQHPARFTGVVCQNDLIALGVIAGLKDAGATVPGSLSVVGIDNVPFHTFTMPGLTTVDTTSGMLAQRAAQLVIHMLNENAENSYTPLSLKPELVIRESVRKVN